MYGGKCILIKKQFTYRKCSRLDKFLVSNGCLDYTECSDIMSAGVKTDHKGIVLNLILTSHKKGPGKWKLNTGILNDKIYYTKIRSLLQQTKDHYKTYSN